MVQLIDRPIQGGLDARRRPTFLILAHDHALALVHDEVFADYPITEDARRVSTVAAEREGLDRMIRFFAEHEGVGVAAS